MGHRTCSKFGGSAHKASGSMAGGGTTMFATEGLRIRSTSSVRSRLLGGWLGCSVCLLARTRSPARLHGSSGENGGQCSSGWVSIQVGNSGGQCRSDSRNQARRTLHACSAAALCCACCDAHLVGLGVDAHALAKRCQSLSTDLLVPERLMPGPVANAQQLHLSALQHNRAAQAAASAKCVSVSSQQQLLCSCMCAGFMCTKQCHHARMPLLTTQHPRCHIQQRYDVSRTVRSRLRRSRRTTSSRIALLDCRLSRSCLNLSSSSSLQGGWVGK